MKKRDKDTRETTQKQSGRDWPKTADRSTTPHKIFRGKHKDLYGWTSTYDTVARAYQYNKTTKAIAEWIKLNLKFPMDVWRILMTLKEPNMEEWRPKAPKKEEDKV
eukprot:TRINITY_DN569_c2_g1_i2.p1 TRINITY_DN569_c2_g1~~TRINITY_DN569_c2_g1_i2.p1  ORF type:complete len:106 (+),score=5.06 TRINITY_DN569_c2_g1_i2:52-369(+)